MKLRTGRRLDLCEPAQASFSGTGWSAHWGDFKNVTVEICFHHTNDDYPRRKVRLDMDLAEAEVVLEALSKTVADAKARIAEGS